MSDKEDEFFQWLEDNGAGTSGLSDESIEQRNSDEGPEVVR